ncbi:hypothetical protein QBC40DRAFT_277757 [Triangularia verruculosa]|uniref:Uncharacterized protein n=1 Tax=Triangularia verruculosa TaxID=2587418 RepID=A0AAN7AWQ2_9PEZI|nr:hypothetical protein QBC40DRAFT_277757 [Triangularia verruculosa]
MISFTIGLCNNTECSNSTHVDDDDVTDPDIAGIGILLSFVIPAVAAIVAFMLAWILRRIPQQQYNHVDEMALSWLTRCVPWLRRKSIRNRATSTTAPEISGYQTFILSVNDQMLLTGLGLIIAIYSQICTISMFSFHVAAGLASLCSSVHLATLTVLRLPFKESTKAQSISRVALMILGLLAILASKFLQYHTGEYANNDLAACNIAWPQKGSDIASTVWDWVCVALALSVNYYQSIVTDVAPRRTRANSEPNPKLISSWILFVLKNTHKYPEYDLDIAALIAEKQQKIEESCRERLVFLIGAINGRRSRTKSTATFFISVLRTVGFHMFIELQNSLVYDLFLCIFWFALGITDVFQSLTHDGADIQPLLEWKFGQVMPVVLLFTYVLFALGIRPSSKKSPEKVASGNKPSSTTLHQDSDSAASTDSEVASCASSGVSLRTLSNLGLAAGDEEPGPKPTRRVNTSELERAIVPRTGRTRTWRPKQQPLLNINDHDAHPIDLIDFTRKEARAHAHGVVVVAFTAAVAFLMLLYFFFTWVVTILTGLYILLFVYRVVKGSADIRRIKKARQSQVQSSSAASSLHLVGSSPRSSMSGSRSLGGLSDVSR